MRISDWSSDVCSSDLEDLLLRGIHRRRVEPELEIHRDAEQDRDHADRDEMRRREIEQPEQVERGQRIGCRQLLDPQHERLMAHFDRQNRTEVGRVGDECVSKGSIWWSMVNEKNKIT